MLRNRGISFGDINTIPTIKGNGINVTNQISHEVERESRWVEETRLSKPKYTLTNTNHSARYPMRPSRTPTNIFVVLTSTSRDTPPRIWPAKNLPTTATTPIRVGIEVAAVMASLRR